MSSTIFEVLESGSIVAGDEEMGYLVTINGSYLNLWSSCHATYSSTRGLSEIRWNNIDCRATNLPRGLYECTAANAWDMGKEWLAEILADLNGERDLDECADCGASTAPGTSDPHVCGEGES